MVRKKQYNVEVSFGKTIDIISLKENMISYFELEVKNMKASRNSLINVEFEKVDTCPFCG